MGSSESIVKLNVGGTVFVTLKSTLTKHHGIFKALVKTEMPAEDGDSFFIDRSPKHFETVLNYIRSGDVDLPDSENELKELKREAEYYSLEKLATLCQSSMPKIKSYKTADELLNMIANTKKVVVVIHYLAYKNQLHTIPLGFKFSEFVERNKDKAEVFIYEIKDEEELKDKPYVDDPNRVWSFCIFNSEWSENYPLKSLRDIQVQLDCFGDF